MHFDVSIKTNRKISVAFLILILIGFIFVLYTSAASKVISSNADKKGTYEILEPDSIETVEDEQSPTGYRTDYYLTLPSILNDNCTLVFHSSHSLIKVYDNDILIYTLEMDNSRKYTSLIGNNWNSIAIENYSAGDKIVISFYPVYSDVPLSESAVYFGSEYAIAKNILMNDLPILLIALIITVLGMVFIIYSLFNIKRTISDNSLFMLGIFSFMLGIWKTCDLDAFLMLFPHSNIVSQLCFYALMMLLVPFTYFLKSLYSTRDFFLWYIPIASGFISAIASFVLEFTGRMDFKQSISYTHDSYALLIVIAVIMTVYEIKTTGLSRTLKINLICMGLCLLGLSIDIGTYYMFTSARNMYFGILFFCIFIIYQGVHALTEAKTMIKKGESAELYRDMAYHDQLTNLYNRTAYEVEIHSDEFNPKNTVVSVFDLNNLKICNDTFGHEMGDFYIKSAAEAINKAYNISGKVFRMGGDEFTVLSYNTDSRKCMDCAQKARDILAEKAGKHPGVSMGLSCGIMAFDRNKDYDIKDTEKRADRLMYRDKLKIKDAQ